MIRVSRGVVVRGTIRCLVSDTHPCIAQGGEAHSKNKVGRARALILAHIRNRDLRFAIPTHFHPTAVDGWFSSIHRTGTDSDHLPFNSDVAWGDVNLRVIVSVNARRIEGNFFNASRGIVLYPTRKSQVYLIVGINYRRDVQLLAV